MSPKEEIIKQLEKLSKKGKKLVDSFSIGHMGSEQSSEPEEKHREFVTASLAAISRIAGKDSEYYTSIPREKMSARISVAGYDAPYVTFVLGAVEALMTDVENNYLVTLESKLRANVHDDFLEQATALLDASYHVAAVVLAGGVLENHLQKLADSNGLSWNGSGSLSKYNDLLKEVVYPQPVWRRIQAILDIRNEAAHGGGASVGAEDVKDSISFIHRMLTDYPC